jgi:hypothetical protein
MSPDDRQLFDEHDRGFEDRNADRGLSDRNLSDRQADRGMDRGFEDRNLAAEDRQFAEDRNLADRGLDDRALEQQLADAGRQARLSAGGVRPDMIYAAQLRERLVTRLETSRPPLFPWAFGQRIARVAPLSIAALLFAVAMVGAAQLHIGASDPSPSPVAATDEPTPGEDPTFAPDASDDAHVIPGAPSTTPAPAVTPAPTTQPVPPPPPPPPPTPPPSSAPEAMSLSLKGCNGGVLIQWSKSHASDFNHYTTLRNTTANIPMAYPPQGGAVDFGGTYTTDRFTLSAADVTAAAGVTYYYRTMAFNAGDGVIGASSVVSAVAQPVASLGSLNVAPDAGGTLFSWSPFPGNGACFTWYKLVASTTNPNPSYLNGDSYIWYSGSTGDTSAVVPDLVSGQTYYLKVEVIKSSGLGTFVAAQSNVVTYPVP